MNIKKNNSAESAAKLIYWRVSIRHYDFTKSITATMSYGYHTQPPVDTMVKNKEPGWSGWTEIKFFKEKSDAHNYILEVEKFVG